MADPNFKYQTVAEFEAENQARKIAAAAYANWMKAQSAAERRDIEAAVAGYAPRVQQKFFDALRDREKSRGLEPDVWPMLGAAGGATKGLAAMAGRAAGDFAVTRPQTQDALTALGKGMMALPVAIPATAIPRASSKLGSNQILDSNNRLVGMSKPNRSPRLPGAGFVPLAILSAILGGDSRTDKQLEDEAFREVK